MYTLPLYTYVYILSLPSIRFKYQSLHMTVILLTAGLRRVSHNV